MISYSYNMSFIVKHSRISFLEHVPSMNVNEDNRFRNVVIYFYSTTGLQPVLVDCCTHRYHHLSSLWIETDIIYIKFYFMFFRRIYNIKFIRTTEIIQALIDLSCFQRHGMFNLRCVTISTSSLKDLLSIKDYIIYKTCSFALLSMNLHCLSECVSCWDLKQ